MVTSHFVQQKKVLKKEDIFGNIFVVYLNLTSKIYYVPNFKLSPQRQSKTLMPLNL